MRVRGTAQSASGEQLARGGAVGADVVHPRRTSSSIRMIPASESRFARKSRPLSIQPLISTAHRARRAQVGTTTPSGPARLFCEASAYGDANRGGDVGPYIISRMGAWKHSGDGAGAAAVQGLRGHDTVLAFDPEVPVQPEPQPSPEMQPIL